MQKVELTQGYHAIIDDEDLFDVSIFSWYAAKLNKEIRPVRSIQWYDNSDVKHRKLYFLHNYIGECIFGPLQSGFYIDHVNRDALDNRRSNLRVATFTQNVRNSTKSKNRSSIYKGVSFAKDRNRWHAEISPNRTRINLGYFKDEKQAAMAYNEAAVKHFGEFANLNVIED